MVENTKFEDFLEEVMNRGPLNGRETVELTQDGNAETIQFSVYMKVRVVRKYTKYMI